MSIRCRYSVAAVLVGLIFNARDAAADGAWYIGGSAGAVFPMDDSRAITIKNFATGAKGPGTNTSTYNPGESANISIGYGLSSGFRIEGELGFQHYFTDTISPLSKNGQFPNLNGSRLSNPDGGAHQVFTQTLNVLYDIPYTFYGITPYVGVGGGNYYAINKSAVFLFDNGRQTITARGNYADSGTVLGEIGVSYPLTPKLSLLAAYRYEHFFHTGTAAIDENIVNIGLRYTFDTPPVPAAAPPTGAVPLAAAARSYLVFFDWDKATLTDRAGQIVAEAAAGSTKVKYSQIEVSGYTDTSGTPQYNKGLSIRRADAVAAELIKDGVPKTAISIQGFGETHLLVPTGPGVREPQNRRVEIIIR